MAAPVPLFLDVDGTLIGDLEPVGSIWIRLRRAPLDRDLPADAEFPAEAWFDAEVVGALNELIGSGLVEPIWMTTWNEKANTLLAPALGLVGAPWPVAAIGTRRGGMMRDGIWVKATAVNLWLRENEQEGGPFIVMDDMLRGDSPQKASMEAVNTGEGLLVGTRREHGLHVEQIAEIRAFVERQLGLRLPSDSLN